jgi:hypothetical protein
MIGILSISYNTKEYKLTQEDRTYIYLKAGAIGALLEEYLKTKKS